MSGEYSIFAMSPGDPGRPPTVVIADDQALVRSGFRLILKAAGINVVAEAANGAEAVAAAGEHRPDVVLMDVRMPVMDGIEATRRILDVHPASSDGDSPEEASAGTEEPPPRTLRSASCCYQADAPRIIILTTFDLDEYVYAALTAGASGFLLKDVTPEYLVAAVHLVRTGDALLAPSITRRLVERFASPPGGAAMGGGATGGGATGASGPGASGPGTLGTRDPGDAGIARGPRGAGAGAGTARACTGAVAGAEAMAGTADVSTIADAGTVAGATRPGAAAPGRPGGDISALTPRELEVLGLMARGLSNAEIASELVLSEATVKTHVARILTKLSLRDRVQAVVLAYETGLISPGS